VTVILDSGALIAAERGDRELMAIVKRERREGRVPVTSAGVVAQVWRGGPGRQAQVARLLRGVSTVAIDEHDAHRIGLLLGAAGTSDVVDAALVLLSGDGDEVFTSDPEDIAHLAEAARLQVDVIRMS
jgi:hypothetical protein